MWGKDGRHLKQHDVWCLLFLFHFFLIPGPEIYGSISASNFSNGDNLNTPHRQFLFCSSVSPSFSLLLWFSGRSALLYFSYILVLVLVSKLNFEGIISALRKSLLEGSAPKNAGTSGWCLQLWIFLTDENFIAVTIFKNLQLQSSLFFCSPCFIQHGLGKKKMGKIMIAARCFIASLLYIQTATVEFIYFYLYYYLYVASLE